MSIDTQHDTIGPESGASETMTATAVPEIVSKDDESASLELPFDWDDVFDKDVTDDLAPEIKPFNPISRKKWWRDLPTSQALATLAWQKATKGTGLKKLISKPEQFILIVLVPSEAWFKSIRSFLPARHLPHICEARQQARSKSSAFESDIDGALRNQRSIIVIASDARCIPSAVQSSADLTISVPAPDAELISLLLKRTGRGPVPQNLDASTIAGLDFADFCAIIRPGKRVTETVNALTQASAHRVLLPAEAMAPPLETTRAFGAAGIWGAQLARDIADFRAGKVGWSEVDRGALIFGPPGTGKSLFARSLAQHCKVPLILATVSDYFADTKGDLDSVIKAQREVFARAAIVRPSILFLDEIDAIPNRNTISNRGRDWWAPIINDFLTLLDSATSSRAGIVVIGATNMIASIDPAILRPGRLERAIELGPPDAEGLADILRHHLGRDLEGGDLLGFARRHDGATGAIAMEWVRSARRRARTGKRPLEIADLEAAAADGPLPSASEMRRAAIHEIGHAIAILHYGGTVESIVLNPGGAVGGRVREQSRQPSLLTKADLISQCVVLLAGRAAEDALLGAPSSGSGGTTRSDLARATALVTAMHRSLGLGADLVYSEYALMDEPGWLPPDLHRRVADDLAAAYDHALDIVRANRLRIEMVAERLIESRFLSGSDLEALLAHLDVGNH